MFDDRFQLPAKLAGERIAKEDVSKNRKCGRTEGFVNCDIVRAVFRVLPLRHLSTTSGPTFVSEVGDLLVRIQPELINEACLNLR